MFKMHAEYYFWRERNNSRELNAVHSSGLAI